MDSLGIFSDIFRCRIISDKEVIIREQQVFHDYSTIMPVSQIITVLAKYMREVCEKTRLGRNNCELIGSKLTSQSREISQSMESGLTRREGRYVDPGDHRYSSRVARAVD